MGNRLIVMNRLDSFDHASFAPALRDLLLKDQMSDTLADVLFHVSKYAKGTGSGVISVPESQANSVIAELRRLVILDEDEPLIELFEFLYKRLREAAPRR